MTVYSGLLFVHIAATLGLFAGFGLEWSAILQLRRTASVELARAWVGVFGPLGRLYGISLATILISGALLARIVGFWGAAWLYVAFGAMALLPALGPVVSRRRIGLLRRALDAERGST